MPTSPQYVSTSQAAERLGLSREHVRRLIQRGELRAEETVNGFMLDANEVERHAIQRRLLQDQRQFRSAMDDLAAQSRRVSGATGIQSAVAEMRDKMKHRAAFEVPAAIVPQMKLIEQEMAAQKALIALAGPAATVAEKWHRYNEDARRVAENITTAQAGYGANFVSAMDHAIEKTFTAHTDYGAKTINLMDASMSKTQEHASEGNSSRNEILKGGDLDAQQAMTKASGADAWQEELRRRDEWAEEQRRREDAAVNADILTRQQDHFAALARKDPPLTTDALMASRPQETTRGFVVPESREERLEEKMDAISRKVEQLTELVMQQRADAGAAIPTWQEWAGSDRPEDVLAKLAAVREEINGGKQTGENSTDVIREARDTRGGGA